MELIFKYFIDMNIIQVLIYVMYFLPFLSASARPWNITDYDRMVDLAPHSSPLMQTIDSMTFTFSKALQAVSPTLEPFLSVATLAYIGYVGTVMAVPKRLSSAGFPILEDFSEEKRSAKSASFVDSLASGFMKDVISKTEAADVMKNTTIAATKRSIDTLRKTTRMVNLGLSSLLGTVKYLITLFSPDCLSRSMCHVGQFTSIHLPLLGSLLRRINSYDLDDYSQALVAGTTIGDCSAVFHECTL
ncbi:uncharacterized protein LOC118186715 [Stegodyphus dumicola]|uniref:uncharacterized protein LOC118186715 n=1 Tax=Stegodyphus dumicola TaxID=202533 RepID=UPI0015AA24DD|nr:uncharacterized protein LOC118186715 [Stegodyphus dumicola]